MNVLRLWEEVRIEKRAYDYSDRTRVSLRYSFGYLMKLLTETPPKTVVETANLWTLTAGRAYAHVVDPAEVVAISDSAGIIIGDVKLALLREILDEAVAWDQYGWAADIDTIVKLAEEWLDILGVTEDDTYLIPALIEGETEEDADGDYGHGKSEAAESEYEEVTPEESKRLIEAMKESGALVTKEASNIVIRTSDAGQKAQEVFGGKLHSGRGWVSRRPTDEERRTVTKLSEAIGRISYSAAAVRKVPSAVPPGRMRSRDAVRRSAERSRGQMVTAQPWERKKRRHTINPPLTLGLMTDVSGSMHWAQEIVASSAYVFSNSISRIGGRSAAVTFGDKAEGVVRPGEVPTEVHIRDANGGCEMFDHAVAALDGVLHLSIPGGAKLLVVISDGCLVEDLETEKATIWLDRLHRAGTAVVWMNATDSYGYLDWLPAWVEVVELDSVYSGADLHSMVDAIAHSMERAFLAARKGAA
jgi:hypothetical protein